MLLKGFDDASGLLSSEVRRLLAGRGVNPHQREQPYLAYTDTDWDRLESPATQAILLKSRHCDTVCPVYICLL